MLDQRANQFGKRVVTTTINKQINELIDEKYGKDFYTFEYAK